MHRRFLRTLGTGPWLAAAFAGDCSTAAEPPRPPSFPDGAEAEQDDERGRVRNHEAIRCREENHKRGRVFNLSGHGLLDLSADETGRAGKMHGRRGDD